MTSNEHVASTTTTTSGDVTTSVPSERRANDGANERASASKPLARLAFVREYATVSTQYVAQHALTTRATKAYVNARDATTLKGSLTTIESLVARFGAPVAQKVAETAPNALARADANVDAAVKALEGVYDAHVKDSMAMKTAKGAYAYAMSAKAKYPENVETLKAARAEYLAKIEAAIAELRARAVELPHSVVTALTSAIAQARAALDSAALFNRVKTLYEHLCANPRVAAVATRVAPVATRVMQQPIVAKAIDVATPYATALVARVMPDRTAVPA